uniref:Beta-casein n=1 Tax=Catagonus wagneri TaxID=51154 RepID=A0A8C3VN82_9CETA
MKLLIIACLVALALARETVESLSSSEESVTHVSKEKIEKFKREERQQTEDERRKKIHPFAQSQPLAYPYTEPIPYPILPQNILPLAQVPVVVPLLHPEVMEDPKPKETVVPKRKGMSSPKSLGEPFVEGQSLTLTDFESLPLPLLQSLMHQVPQPVPRTPMFPPQPLLSLPQPRGLPIAQQVVPYPQGDMPIQALLLYQDPLLGPLRGLYPVPQPVAPVYNPVIV